MTDPQDPIETWLSADVEILPAPPGAYQRVARRARRRKRLRAAGTVASAAVIIAGGVLVPRLASGILPGHVGPNSVGFGSPHPVTPSGTGTASSQPRTSPSVKAPSSPGGPALSRAGSGPAPPAGFSPTSVTFVNGALGAVLGTAGSACGGPCVTAAGTPDYGSTWTRIGGPAAGPPDGSNGVSQLRFGDQLNGWAFGPALYATHDGGMSWKPIVNLPGRVIDLSVVAGRAFAVVATCAGTGPEYAAGCSTFRLYSAAANSDRWQRVAGASAAASAAPGGLQLTSSQGYLLAGRLLFTGPVNGGAWHQVQPASAGTAGVPPCLRSSGGAVARSGPALIAPAGSELFLACDASAGRRPGQLTFYLSTDTGQTWQARGPIQARGAATSLAAIPGGAVVLATTRGLYYSFDAANWQRGTMAGKTPPHGFAFVGMTNAGQGVAVPAGPGARDLFITRDGGRGWQPAAIG